MPKAGNNWLELAPSIAIVDNVVDEAVLSVTALSSDDIPDSILSARVCASAKSRSISFSATFCAIGTDVEGSPVLCK